MKTFAEHINFNFGKQEHIKFSRSRGLLITPDTEITIWFDSSGSMDSTLSPLQTMRDTLLKDLLLPFYNNDEDLYDEKVTVQSWGDERTFRQLAVEPGTLENGIIHFLFQDEANAVYHGSPFDGSRTSTYDTDMGNLRDKLENVFPANKYEAFIYQVIGQGGWKDFLLAVERGTGNYSGENGLSDIGKVHIRYDIEDGDTPEYYANLLENDIF